MATKSKKIYRKKEDRSLELVGYLPTEDVSSRVDSALATKQDKLTPGKGISINTTTNEISVNDSAFATTDYVMNNFVANSTYEQDKDGLDHDIGGLASRVTANESSINNLNNAVADRYTKAETDSKLNGETVKTNNTKDMTYDEIAAMKRSYVGSSNTGPYKTNDGSHENLIRIVNNYFGGTNYVFEMSHDFWENNGIHYRYKADGGYSQWKTLIDSDSIGSQHVAYADEAGYANSSGTAAVCESTTLLAAEGTNLGAKIKSQYTTGTPGGSVTYHQATWYVLGNDGDTYDFSKMITTDNFGTNLTEALKNTKVEHTTRSDYTTYLDNGNNYSTSIPISYDNDNGTSLKYTSYPKLTINGITGYGVLEGNVYNHGSFQLAVSDNSNGTIYVRSVAKDGSAPSWAKLLIDDDVINSLDSDIINRPLSAYQGKVMSGKITSINSSITSINSKLLGYQPKLNSDTGATMQWLSFKYGSSYSISGIWCRTVEMTIEGSVGTQASANFTVNIAYQSTFNSGSWYFVAMPCEGGFINTLSWGLETNDSKTGGTFYALRVYSGAKTKYKFNIIGIRLY